MRTPDRQTCRREAFPRSGTDEVRQAGKQRSHAWALPELAALVAFVFSGDETDLQRTASAQRSSARRLPNACIEVPSTPKVMVLYKP